MSTTRMRHNVGSWQMRAQNDAYIPGSFPPRTDRSDDGEPTRSQLATLYMREYPIVVAALARFVAWIETHADHIVLVALFGSVARFTPHANSDTDLFVLLDSGDTRDPRVHEDARAREVVVGMMETVYADTAIWPRWGVSLITGDVTARELDPDLLAVIGREGVSLYQSQQTPPPASLARLMPFDIWMERARAHLASLGDATAE